MSSLDSPDRVRRLRRVEYDQLVEAGAFVDERVELLAGLVVRMSPQGPPHAGAIERLNILLVKSLPEGTSLRVQSPLALGDDSEPEPDFAVVPGGSHHRAHPTTAFIVIEVSDSSMARDRRTKGALYAAHGIPEYWIVDTTHQRIEVHSEPADAGYARVTPHSLGETIRSTARPDLTVAVGDVFA